jgi:hypothetical protein
MGATCALATYRLTHSTSRSSPSYPRLEYLDGLLKGERLVIRPPPTYLLFSDDPQLTDTAMSTSLLI